MDSGTLELTKAQAQEETATALRLERARIIHWMRTIARQHKQDGITNRAFHAAADHLQDIINASIKYDRPPDWGEFNPDDRGRKRKTP